MDVGFIPPAEKMHPSNRPFRRAVDGELKHLKGDGKSQFLHLSNYQINKDVLFTVREQDSRVISLRNFIRDDFLNFRLITAAGFIKLYTGIMDAPKGIKAASSRVDGAVAVSSFLRKCTSEFIDAPIKVVNPAISDWKYEGLSSQTYRPGTKCILHVGRQDYVKGTDLLYKAVKGYNQRAKEKINLKLVGKKKPFPKINCSHAQKTGWLSKEEFLSAFQKPELYVQPARAGGFEMGPVEAMRSGIPSIVTENTGCKSLVKDVDENLVAEPSADSIEQKISYFLSLDTETKKELSRKSKEVTEGLTEQNQEKKFKEAFEQLVNKTE
jgi:glycosyltransferase involved in cell wall biosynthesis